jgi:hypothetical protein
LVRRWLRYAALLLALLLTWQLFTMAPGTRWTWGVIIKNALHGNIGVGTWTGVPNRFDFSQLEPGDIIIAGNPGASWCEYTHATLYLGDGQVAETVLRQGVNLGAVERYRDYTWAGALRVDAPPEVKAKAVAAAKSRLGQQFYLLAPRSSGDWFYCTKLVWWAYKQAGVDLDPAGGFWIVPGRFFLSPRVELIDDTRPPEGVTAP